MADKTSNGKAPKLVVLQLTGANDYLNTVVPYTNPLYYDNRPNVHIPAEQSSPSTTPWASIQHAGGQAPLG